MAQRRLERDGLRPIGDFQRSSEAELTRRYGTEGARLARLAHGIDDSPVRSDREAKSISAETTFERDIADFKPLDVGYGGWRNGCPSRLKTSDLAGSTVTLKLKTADFQSAPAPAAQPPRPSSRPGFSPPDGICWAARPTARNSV